MRTTPLSIFLACLLLTLWFASVLGFRWGMELFADFQIVMPKATLWVMAITKGAWVWPLSVFVVVSSVSLVVRPRVGWWLALLVCLLCNSIFVGYALCVVTLFNGIAGADDGSSIRFPFQFSEVGVGIVILVASFALIQVVLGVLFFARRAVSKR